MSEWEDGVTRHSPEWWKRFADEWWPTDDEPNDPRDVPYQGRVTEFWLPLAFLVVFMFIVIVASWTMSG